MKKLIPLFLLAVMFVAGCTGAPITITGPSQLPVINSFNASPDSISVGESSSLNWTVTGATAVSIDQGIGNVALTGPRAVAPAATTVYTLTASSAAGSITATTQVIVSGAASPPASTPPPEPTPAPASVLPVINYFMANPPVISYGGSSMLSWSVSNATSVTIDNGVGPVGSNGTAPVSPATSTNYTLTATNTAGMYYMTITVMVTGAQAAGEPDLIIVDISRSGDKISYTITNQGDGTAGPSTSTLLVDGAVAANDSVGSLAPGESRNETFTGYTYACTLPGDAIIVKADTGNAVVESSEANNSYTKSWSCLMKFIPIQQQ
jgi:archaellum component FlaF (FlaF/FlaG flagellin family)